jgi:hypothetical protein
MYKLSQHRTLLSHHFQQLPRITTVQTGAPIDNTPKIPKMNHPADVTMADSNCNPLPPVLIRNLLFDQLITLSLKRM